VVVNKGLVLDENTAKKLTTLQLSASDQDSEPGELVYRVTKEAGLGHLEHAASPGTPPPHHHPHRQGFWVCSTELDCKMYRLKTYINLGGQIDWMQVSENDTQALYFLQVHQLI